MGLIVGLDVLQCILRFRVIEWQVLLSLVMVEGEVVSHRLARWCSSRLPGLLWPPRYARINY